MCLPDATICEHTSPSIPLYLHTKKQLRAGGVEGLRMRLADVEKELNACLTVRVKNRYAGSCRELNIPQWSEHLWLKSRTHGSIVSNY